MHHGDEAEEGLNYGEIERRRRDRVNELAHRLLLEREKMNRSIEEELSRLSQEALVPDVSQENAISVEDAQSCDAVVAAEHISNSSIHEECITNLPFSDELVSRFVFSRIYVEVEESIRKEKLVMPRTTQIEIKVQVNKRLMQVSGKPGQVERIFDALREYSRFYIFIEIFTLKIIEQGRLQVSSCPGSYREFSELFNRFYSPELMEYFRAVLLTKEATVNTVRGIYSIYFGVLETQHNSEEAWFFIASMLNSRQNEMSCYVVESFFAILGDLLFDACRGPFSKLVDYTRRFYFSDMNNEPCKSRLNTIFSRYGV